jgi:hypothetical protein
MPIVPASFTGDRDIEDSDHSVDADGGAPLLWVSSRDVSENMPGASPQTPAPS